MYLRTLKAARSANFFSGGNFHAKFSARRNFIYFSTWVRILFLSVKRISLGNSDIIIREVTPLKCSPYKC